MLNLFSLSHIFIQNLLSIAMAADPAPTASTQAGPGPLESMIPFAVMIGVFYFFLIRPQAKKQKEHQKVLSELKRGDQVITSGGILGTIEGLTEKFITLEVSEGTKIKILRAQILGVYNPNEITAKT